MTYQDIVEVKFSYSTLFFTWYLFLTATGAIDIASLNFPTKLTTPNFSKTPTRFVRMVRSISALFFLLFEYLPYFSFTFFGLSDFVML